MVTYYHPSYLFSITYYWMTNTMELVKTFSDQAFNPQNFFGIMLEKLFENPIKAYLSDVYHDVEILMQIFASKYPGKYYWIVRNYGTHFIPKSEYDKECNSYHKVEEYIVKFQFNFDFINRTGAIYFVDFGSQYQVSE